MWPTKKSKWLFYKNKKLEYNNTNEWPALVNFLESLSDSEYTRRSSQSAKQVYEVLSCTRSRRIIVMGSKSYLR